MKLIVFLYGLCFGSFALCIAQRLANRESLLTRSHCAFCGHCLSFKNLIPVFSYLFQKGKCPYCGHKLSFLYPFSEIMMGFLLLFIYQCFGFTMSFFLQSLWCILLVIISFEDAFSMEINSFLLLAVILISFHYALIIKIDWRSLLSNIFNIILIKLVMTALSKLKKKEMMGDGDLWLMFGCGIPFSFNAQLYAVLIACSLGVLYEIVFIRNKTKPFPFAPFLCFGYLIVNFAVLFFPLS